MANYLDREIAAKQTHCRSCEKALGNERYECPICAELSCSNACREKHIEKYSKL